jgi:hypothetical protein
MLFCPLRAVPRPRRRLWDSPRSWTWSLSVLHRNPVVPRSFGVYSPGVIRVEEVIMDKKIEMSF